MAIFNKKPFLEYLVQSYSKYNFENIYILTGYMSDKIFNKFEKNILIVFKLNVLKKINPWVLQEL